MQAKGDAPALVVRRDTTTGVLHLADDVNTSPVPLSPEVRDCLEAAWRCGCGVEVWDELGQPLLASSLVPVPGGLARWGAHYRLLVGFPESRVTRPPP